MAELREMLVQVSEPAVDVCRDFLAAGRQIAMLTELMHDLRQDGRRCGADDRFRK